MGRCWASFHFERMKRIIWNELKRDDGLGEEFNSLASLRTNSLRGSRLIVGASHDEIVSSVRGFVNPYSSVGG